ncbi:hypothetical protein [Hymenobacter crusticola]|uniref:hypothetical protein n=1 Tax=Hymenobacter crusticola TaxID=1770526 RepID=UPI0015C51199|nr:hypothetical protein [Hymenobacter crusticola]
MNKIPAHDRLVSEKESSKHITALFDSWDEEAKQEESKVFHKKASHPKQKGKRLRFNHA